MSRWRTLAGPALVLLLAACTPHLGITITNAPTLPECTPGSSGTPCR